MSKLSTEAMDDYGNTGGIGAQIQVPIVTPYTILAIPFNFEIVKATYATSTGTATFTVKINSTTVTSLSGLSASSSGASTNATGANTGSAGDNIVFDVTAVSSPENLSIMLEVVKTKD